ncbi:hypothetical protein EFS38_19490 [Dickeya undicola]|uniref:Uncharacterized protein n=1 Tax=Dickeya undicola TaxID=1577887 RepID=A0ABX9WNN4_9GAMM|nr:hypothetical protein [Dickeya undicola]RNM18965.1 hypothetical protein EFS38_19490 [Dickeya undicola]
MFISDKDVARKIINKSSIMITLIEKELIELGTQMPEEEYNKCKYRVGELLFTLCNVINDISIDHPDLKPKDFPVYITKEERK